MTLSRWKRIIKDRDLVKSLDIEHGRPKVDATMLNNFKQKSCQSNIEPQNLGQKPVKSVTIDADNDDEKENVLLLEGNYNLMDEEGRCSITNPKEYGGYVFK